MALTTLYDVSSCDNHRAWSYIRSFTDNLDELLAGVSVLVDLANITRCHLLVQGNVDSQVNTAEPRGAGWSVFSDVVGEVAGLHMGHESSGCTEMVADLSLMDVACEGVFTGQLSLSSYPHLLHLQGNKLSLRLLVSFLGEGLVPIPLLAFGVPILAFCCAQDMASARIVTYQLRCNR